MTPKHLTPNTVSSAGCQATRAATLVGRPSRARRMARCWWSAPACALNTCALGQDGANVSHDDGRTWTALQVINDSPIDDRDAGIISLGDNRLLVSWFTSDTRGNGRSSGRRRGWLNEENYAAWQETLATWTDDLVDRWLG